MTNNQLLGEIAQSVEQRTENVLRNSSAMLKVLIINKTKMTEGGRGWCFAR